ncbi:autoinducer binding domain-containing protein [Trinickia sp. NRRL B-1857]|uniref:helix-turn-helix transcriptional regulator n=1 Tax=Trinickia sp. NRRL B-1857 TaxID=3162879 RepID=UPI003D283B45
MRTIGAVQSEHSTGEVLFDADVQVLKDRVILRLVRGLDAQYVLEHHLVRIDGTRLIQVLSLAESAVLEEFIAADPYGEHLRTQYDSIGRLCGELTNRYTAHRLVPSDKLDALKDVGAIAACSSESEVMAIAARVLAQCGGQSYTYRWLRIDEKTGAIGFQRTLVGCHPAWLHTYAKRQWYKKDPFVEYARRNGSPARSSDVSVFGNEHWGREEASRYGFRSTIVCPAHPASGPSIGLLQVGNELPSEEGEQALWQHRVLFRALADEMLDWGIARRRSEEASRVALEPRELVALRLLRDGRTAFHVAENLGVSERTAYGIFRKINDKLGVSHIARAVEMAAERGLIE